MKQLKLKTEEDFSTESLISVLSEIQLTPEEITIDLEVKFKNAIVNIVGKLKGFYHSSKDDSPQYSDLYDVRIELSLVNVKYSAEYLKKRVRSIMLN